VTEDKWVATCVLVDKLEKVPLSSLKNELVELKLSEEAVTKLLDSLKVSRVTTYPLISHLASLLYVPLSTHIDRFKTSMTSPLYWENPVTVLKIFSA